MIKCPICGKYEFEEIGNYDICHICFWENDGLQYYNPNYSGGANYLSLNDYKKWWDKINKTLPLLIKKLKIKKVEAFVEGQYLNLLVPIQHIREYVNKMTENNIQIRLNFYNLCKKYNYDVNKFIGFLLIDGKTIKDNNEEILNIIFSKNILKTCKNYGLTQVVEILKKSKNTNEWGENLPCIDIDTNPKEL